MGALSSKLDISKETMQKEVETMEITKEIHRKQRYSNINLRGVEK